MNTAIDQQGQLVGFAIPSDDVQKDLLSYQKGGKITKPFLGVEYVQITPEVKQKYSLKADNGAWITSAGDSTGASPIVPGSAADKAGLKNNDIIISVNGQALSQTVTLAGLIKNFNPGDILNLEVLRGTKTIPIKVILGQK